MQPAVGAQIGFGVWRSGCMRFDVGSKEMASTNRQNRDAEIVRTRRAIQDERLMRARLADGTVSCASDSKWCRIFEALREQLKEQPSHSGSLTRIKLLKSEESFDYRDLLASCFEDTYLDGMSGPIYYREIEWIDVQTGGVQPEFDCQVDFEVRDRLARIYGYRQTISQQDAPSNGG
jgi:hypothetical protein